MLTAGTAWIGVVLGHVAACFLAYPEATARAAHLHESGHIWVTLAVPSLLAVVPVVLLSVVLGGLRSQRSWIGEGLALRLATIQLVTFALIELFVQRGDLGAMLASPAVFFGLALQPLLALLMAWTLELFRRAVRSVAARLRFTDPTPAHASGPRRGLWFEPRGSWLLLSSPLRAPPPPVLS